MVGGVVKEKLFLHTYAVGAVWEAQVKANPTRGGGGGGAW